MCLGVGAEREQRSVACQLIRLDKVGGWGMRERKKKRKRDGIVVVRRKEVTGWEGLLLYPTGT